MRLSKDWRALLKLTGKITGILLLAGFFTLGGIAFGAVRGIIERTPGLDLDSIAPKGYATMIYDSKGNLTDTLVMEGSNRDPAAFEELPEDLINAFVAIEDARFWEHNGIDLRAIARAGGVSVSACCESFRKHTGQTPVGYLTRYRLRKGMEQLLNPNLSVGEVARSVGFASASYFIECFKRYLHTTPLAYRRDSGEKRVAGL